jgi:hypothetical protein
MQMRRSSRLRLLVANAKLGSRCDIFQRPEERKDVFLLRLCMFGHTATKLFEILSEFLAGRVEALRCHAIVLSSGESRESGSAEVKGGEAPGVARPDGP